jgi:hypothetical protein
MHQFTLFNLDSSKITAPAIVSVCRMFIPQGLAALAGIDQHRPRPANPHTPPACENPGSEIQAGFLYPQAHSQRCGWHNANFDRRPAEIMPPPLLCRVMRHSAEGYVAHSTPSKHPTKLSRIG